MHQTHTTRHQRPIPEARVTGRPRLVVGRSAGVPQLTDAVTYALATLALATIVVLPAIVGR